MIINSEFYECIQLNGKVQAAIRYGFIDGDLGVHRVCGTWVIVYLPTGQRIPLTIQPKNYKAALKQAQRQIKGTDRFKKNVEDAKESEFFKLFEQSRKEQEGNTND